MVKRFKLPKKINGFRLPKRARKQANKLIANLQGDELEALVSAFLAAVLLYFVERSTPDGEALPDRIGRAGSQLKH